MISREDVEKAEIFEAGRKAGRKEVLDDFSKVVDAVRENMTNGVGVQILTIFTTAEVALRRKFDS